MRKITVLLLNTLLLSSLFASNKIPPPNKITVSIGAYNQSWGQFKFRNTTDLRPLIYKTTRKSKKDLILQLKRPYRKIFNHLFINYGMSLGYHKFAKDITYSLSIFPEISLQLFTNTKITPFINWAIGGPTLFNRNEIDGKKFTRFNFLDYFDIGLQAKNITLSCRFIHYSDWFITKDKGFDIPFLISLSYRY